MKLCVAQTRPVTGQVQTNIEEHEAFIRLAVSNGADLIVFPELSLTGYEPALAKELAVDPQDPQLNTFQQISDASRIIIGAGIPTKTSAGVSISMLLFQPDKPRQVYSKAFLHTDELPFFTSGKNYSGLTINGNRVALAICYELSVPEHAANAAQNGAQVYIASVAKPSAGAAKAAETLSGIAEKYGMTVLMSNSVGYCDNFESGGRTAAWNKKGQLLLQLNETDEGLIIIDTVSGELIKK